MSEARDHCPDCGHKLHPQELETLFRGKKLDCWHCRAPLKAHVKGAIPTIAQGIVAALPVIDSFTSDEPTGWIGYAFAGLVILAIHFLPPGLIHGAPWVRIINGRSLLAVEEE